MVGCNAWPRKEANERIAASDSFIFLIFLYRIEKYRPVVLQDITGNEETIERLKVIAQKGNMPNMILSGSPGIGKTTSLLCLARELLGDKYSDAVLELNASDER